MFSHTRGTPKTSCAVHGIFHSKTNQLFGYPHFRKPPYKPRPLLMGLANWAWFFFVLISYMIPHIFAIFLVLGESQFLIRLLGLIIRLGSWSYYWIPISELHLLMMMHSYYAYIIIFHIICPYPLGLHSRIIILWIIINMYIHIISSYLSIFQRPYMISYIIIYHFFDAKTHHWTWWRTWRHILREAAAKSGGGPAVKIR